MKHLEPIKAEFIVRGYMTGSILRAYTKGERSFCGEHLPDDIQPFQELPRLLLTPSTKAEGHFHDESRTPEQLLEDGVLSLQEWNQIAQFSRKLFEWGSEVYRKLGWILVDTKYEFAKDTNGDIFLIDEFHTPDSSRLWKKETYARRIAHAQAPEMFDKEIVRRHLAAMGFLGEGPVPAIPQSLSLEILRTYLQITEDLWQKPFYLDAADPELVLLGLLSQH